MWYRYFTHFLHRISVFTTFSYGVAVLGDPIRTVECNAMEESEKKITRRKRGRKGRDEPGNACEICFQKVIPPTLSANNLNVVSSVKSCQSSNKRHTALRHCLLNFKKIGLCSDKTSPVEKNKAKVKRLYSQAKQRLISKDGSYAYLIFLKRSERKDFA